MLAVSAGMSGGPQLQPNLQGQKEGPDESAYYSVLGGSLRPSSKQCTRHDNLSSHILKDTAGGGSSSL